MKGMKTSAVQAFWERCRGQFDIETHEYQASTFADPKFASYQGELIELAVTGSKRATAHMELDFIKNGIPRRQTGDYWIIVTDANEPKCLVRITDVDIRPFNKVSAEFAAREGEGDCSLEYWTKVHKEYFELQCKDWGIQWDEDYMIVCEGFELLRVA